MASKNNNTFLTFLGNGSHSKVDADTYGRLSSGTSEEAKETVAKLFGDGVSLQQTRSVNLDHAYGSAPHSSLGLQVAIAGRSTVVQADVVRSNRFAPPHAAQST